MAITMPPFERDLYDLRERMNRARSRDEFEYYETRYREAMREYDYARMRMMPPPQYMIEPKSIEQRAIDKAVASKPTELSFLSSADKKLLLIGEMA